MELEEKELYESHTSEPVEMNTEGIVCASGPSGTGNGFADGWDF